MDKYKQLKNLVENYISKIMDESLLDEMAYPTQFNFETFKNLTSFKAKQQYALENLQGKIGAGSSRAVFKIDDDKVLKVAMNKKGIAQNEEEINIAKYDDFSVATKIFEYDDDDFMWLEMELAKKVTPKRFKEVTGLSLQEVIDGLMSTFVKRDKNVPQETYDNEFFMNLQDLVGGYQFPVPGDFQKISTYGEVDRGHGPEIVVVDLGFTNSTSKLYR